MAKATVNNRPNVATAPKKTVKKTAPKRKEDAKAKEAAKVANEAKKTAAALALATVEVAKVETVETVEVKPLTAAQLSAKAIKAIESDRHSKGMRSATYIKPSAKMKAKEALTLIECLACTVRGQYSLEIASEIVSFYGSKENLLKVATFNDFLNFANIGKQGAVSSYALIEAMRSMQ